MRTTFPLAADFFRFSRHIVAPLLIASVLTETAHGGTHDPHGRRNEDRAEMRARAQESAQLSEGFLSRKGMQGPDPF